uniref:hypothetical protein n=1 Tax=[Lactobacillus] rogosae TaxID=706562 RepID=UPI00402AD3E6
MLLKIIFTVIIIIALTAIFVMSMVKSSSLVEYYLKDINTDDLCRKESHDEES